jgi:hypothetical protein
MNERDECKNLTLRKRTPRQLNTMRWLPNHTGPQPSATAKDHKKGHEESSKARSRSKTAHEQSEMAHGKSQSAN